MGVDASFPARKLHMDLPIPYSLLFLVEDFNSSTMPVTNSSTGEPVSIDFVTSSCGLVSFKTSSPSSPTLTLKSRPAECVMLDLREGFGACGISTLLFGIRCSTGRFGGSKAGCVVDVFCVLFITSSTCFTVGKSSSNDSVGLF